DLIDVGGHDLVDRSERVRERARRRRPDVPDTESVQQAIDGPVLGLGNGRLEVGDGLLLEVRQLAELGWRQEEDVPGVGDQASIEQLPGGSFAEVLDVHGASSREVDYACQDLRRALQV